ncbi:ABC transporter permease [Tengunoibacter tsumagoiensis]|uniref:ABC transporter permease n=1 Tax=Tengunoibacter tsumagoiensis TaxID=2014871 RepID=A0A402AAC2_9CHLR|nr:ABC transporter permease subunit [Tengunoibacter tsumagoiensis]GCE15986.1 ABC transporter permease [Tengunoibacter tsumagoiensis]
MAQVFIPENPREREQLQQGSTPAASTVLSRRETHEPRRFGSIDLLIAVVIIASISLLVVAASHWTAPMTPALHLDLSPLALPVYAGYSLLRMMLGYLIALIFTLTYGHIAATNKRASIVMVPLLDILQSIPILSFLPAVLLALVAIFPHSNIGLELASVLLIFTSQAWNMTFSFYHSVRTLPAELLEFSAIARLRPWQKFLKLAVPASMIGLIWNSMMSWAGGWFFLTASEQFTLGDRSFQLPGIGSYLQAATLAGNIPALIMGFVVLIAMIVLLDILFWRPLVAWADKFKVEMSGSADVPYSPVLNLLQRSALIANMNRRLFRPIGNLLASFLNRMQPLPDNSVVRVEEKTNRKLSARRIFNSIMLLALSVIVLFGIWRMGQLLLHVSWSMWLLLVIAAGATWVRTIIALLIGVAWTVPVGVAIGLSPRWSRRLQPVVQVIASIPATALFPVILLLFVGLPGGLSWAAIILMLLGTQWYILFNVIAGAMAIPSDLREATTIYHVLSWRRWRTLFLPAIFPYLITGLLTASGGAWNASIVSEYVQYNQKTLTTLGLGASIAQSAADANFPLLLAGTLMMAAVVVLINRLLWKRLYALAERRYTLA